MQKQLKLGTVHMHKATNQKMVITKERGDVYEVIGDSDPIHQPDMVEARFEAMGKYMLGNFYYFEFEHQDVDTKKKA